MIARSRSVTRFTLGVLLLCVLMVVSPVGTAPAVALPDLVVNAVTAPVTPYAGQWVSVLNSVSNAGDAATGSSFGIGFYLSQDAVIDGGDSFLGYRVSAPLGVSGVSADSTSLQIPPTAPPGTYYIIVWADYTYSIPENSEGNNFLASNQMTIAKPDLRITSAASNAGAVAGGAFSVSATVNNNGGSQSQPCTLRSYLSTDTQVDPDDVVLHNYSLSAMNAQASGTPGFATQLPLATAPGTYYVLLKIDATEVVDESNESNNTYTVQSVVIAKPDLSASILTGTQVVSAGQAYQYNNQFVNIGGSTSAETTASFYLSADAVFDEGDVLLGERILPSLTPNSTAPGTSGSGQNTLLTIPASTPPGGCYLLAVADVANVVDESNESNNVRTLSLTVLNTAPVADAGGPYSGTEGVPIQIDGSASYDPNAPTGSIESWEWDLDGDGQFDDASGETTEVTFPDNGEFEIGLRVTDDGGLTHEDTATVTVTNTAPSLTVSQPGTVVEGSQLVLGAEFGDPGLEDTHTATVDWGDGSAVQPAAVARPQGEATGTVAASHVYADNGGYTVTVTIEDDDGGTDTDTIVVTVTNVAPTVASVSVSDPTPSPGQALQFAANFTDPGVLDTHGVMWTWGDGTSSAGTVNEAGGSGTATGSHTYTTPGVYPATCTVTDKDGDTGQKSVTVTVEEDTPPPVSFVPIAGDDRYATAVQASQESYPDGAGTVILATGVNWPDALGGSALAGAVDGPLLLTKTTALPEAVAAEISRLGATRVYILGGTAAISTAVQSALPGTVTRIAGSDRYDTANKVADEVIRLRGDAFSGAAYVATGNNFPDALGASPLAASSATPILLARSNATPYLPAAVRSATILGGGAAVTSVTEAAIRSALGSANVLRVGGSDRYDTAAKVADYGVATGMHWDGVGIATGMAFPDALSGGAMLGRAGSVLLLTKRDELVPPARERLAANAAEIASVYYIGGTAAVSQTVRDEIETLLE